MHGTQVPAVTVNHKGAADVILMSPRYQWKVIRCQSSAYRYRNHLEPPRSFSPQYLCLYGFALALLEIVRPRNRNFVSSFSTAIVTFSKELLKAVTSTET